VAGDDLLDGLFHLLFLLLKVCLGPAPLLRGVRGEFAAVHGKHFLADQAHLVADQEHFEEELDDLLVQGGDEIGDGGEVGLGVGGQGHENDVLPAALLDLPAGGDAPGIGVKNDLQEDRRIVGRCAGFVVLVPKVKDGKVNLVVYEIVEGMLEGAGEDLFVEADGDELALGVVVVFISRHRSPALRGFGGSEVRFDGVNIA
jgi:hypothetical protein